MQADCLDLLLVTAVPGHHLCCCRLLHHVIIQQCKALVLLNLFGREEGGLRNTHDTVSCFVNTQHDRWSPSVCQSLMTGAGVVPGDH